MILVSTLGFISVPTFSTRRGSERAYLPSRNEIVPELHRVTGYMESDSASNSDQGSRRRCDCYDLYDQLVPYNEAWFCQKHIVRERQSLMERNEDYTDTLIILQHPPVYTLGTGSSEEYLNFDISDAPHDVYRTERGGEVTYHGPGQLVMYPIINLRYHKMDLHWYLRALEEVVIRVLSSTFSIEASRLEGFTGVWVGNQKLAAIGVRVSKWMAYHGLALNVTTNLTPFEHIIPCGIRNRGIGSIKKFVEELRFSDGGRTKDTLLTDACQLVDMTHKSLLKEFSEVFQLALHHRPVSDLKNLKEKSSGLLTGKHI